MYKINLLIILLIFSIFSAPATFGEDFLFCNVIYHSTNVPQYAKEVKSNLVFKIDYQNLRVYKGKNILKSNFKNNEIYIEDSSKYENGKILFFSKSTYTINRYTGQISGNSYYKTSDYERFSSISGNCSIRKRKF